MKKNYLFSRKKRIFRGLSEKILKMMDNGSWEQLADKEKNYLLRKVKNLFGQIRNSLFFFEYKKMVFPLIAGIGLLADTANAQVNVVFAEPVVNPFGLYRPTYGGGFQVWNVAPFVGDLDNDGDIDLMLGDRYGSNSYFENIGTAENPQFAAHLENPFGIWNLAYYGNWNNGEFVDIDDDGDLDIIGNSYGQLYFFENIGTPEAPQFLPPVYNPFGFVKPAVSNLSVLYPAFADMDNDGDLDMMIGSNRGFIYYYPNIGTAESPLFDSSNPGVFGIDIRPGIDSDSAAITLFDLDMDGDYDILSGSSNQGFYYIENIGTPESPAFADPVLNPFGLYHVLNFLNPKAVDLDGDGDMDLIVGGDGPDTVFYIKNITCITPALNVVTPAVEVCAGDTAILEAETDEGLAINWYFNEDDTEPAFTGSEFTTPELTTSTSYWVEAVKNVEENCYSDRIEVPVTVNPVPVLTVQNTSPEACEGTSIPLTATTDTGVVKWYDNADATEPVFTGTEYATPELTETTSFWIEAVSEAGCVSEREVIVVTVLPAPVLNLETTEYAICTGTEAQLFAASPGNVIFWYSNEDDEDYLYHGNLFQTPELTESTTYWVEAYNIATGCYSERMEIGVTVNPIPDAPIAVEIQYFEEGATLAEVEIEAEGEITWYADINLTVVLPETTLIVENTTYYATQTIEGCESEAVAVNIQFLGLFDVNNAGFAYYPNPVKDVLHFRGNENIRSVEVFDLSGRLILSRYQGLSEINVTSLSKGSYIVKIITDKQTRTFKIIKD